MTTFRTDYDPHARFDVGQHLFQSALPRPLDLGGRGLTGQVYERGSSAHESWPAVCGLPTSMRTPPRRHHHSVANAVFCRRGEAHSMVWTNWFPEISLLGSSGARDILPVFVALLAALIHRPCGQLFNAFI